MEKRVGVFGGRKETLAEQLCHLGSLVGSFDKRFSFRNFTGIAGVVVEIAPDLFCGPTAVGLQIARVAVLCDIAFGGCSLRMARIPKAQSQSMGR
jgi:hypothetical protein